MAAIYIPEWFPRSVMVSNVVIAFSDPLGMLASHPPKSNYGDEPKAAEKEVVDHD